jgi:hypothetical protein
VQQLAAANYGVKNLTFVIPAASRLTPYFSKIVKDIHLIDSTAENLLL